MFSICNMTSCWQTARQYCGKSQGHRALFIADDTDLETYKLYLVDEHHDKKTLRCSPSCYLQMLLEKAFCFSILVTVSRHEEKVEDQDRQGIDDFV